MKRLTATICLTITILLGSAGVSWGQGIPSLDGLDYETRSSIQLACVVQKTQGPAVYARCINGQLASIGSNSNTSARESGNIPSTNYPRASSPACAENGSCYGDISKNTGRPKTVGVRGYTRKDGTYVRGHYRSTPR